MRKRHNLRRMNNSVGCAFVLFVRFECIILASRPVGYPNGNFLVRDTLRPAFVFDFNIEKQSGSMLQRKTLLTYNQIDKAVGVRYRQGEKLIFQKQVRCYIPFEKCVNSVCKMSVNIILKAIFTFGEELLFLFIIR